MSRQMICENSWGNDVLSIIFPLEFRSGYGKSISNIKKENAICRF